MTTIGFPENENESGFIVDPDNKSTGENSGFITRTDPEKTDLNKNVSPESGFVTGSPDNNIFSKREKYTDIEKAPFQGAMSDIYTARQDRIRRVIIKRLKKEFVSDLKRTELFFKEYIHGIMLQHVNLVRMDERGVDENGPFIVMDYVDGTSLSGLIAQGMDERMISKITLQLLDVVSYLHKSQVVHRDLKPDNILITKEGAVKLIDLGLAYSDHMVDDLVNAGTPNYMSPEIRNGQKDIDGRSDIYSLGIIMLEMFTRSTDRTRLDQIGDQAWRNIVSKCIEPNRMLRFSNCLDICSDINLISRPSHRNTYQNVPETHQTGTVHQAAEPVQIETARISIQFAGANLPSDLMVDLFFNNQLIEKISVKRGFKVTATVVKGNNTLLFQGASFRKEFNIMISNTSRDYKMILEYSRIGRNFTDSYYLN